MATLRDLLTEKEIQKCFGNDHKLPYDDISITSLKDFETISWKLLPLIYPIGIVTASSPVISIGFTFLSKRAEEKGIPLFKY